MGETEDYAEDVALVPHGTTHQDGGSDEVNVTDLSGELADEQKSAWPKVSGKPSTFTPSAHASTHEDGDADEIDVADLSGELADEQKSAWAKVSGKPSTFPPDLHALTHKLGGTDVIDIAGLIFKSVCYAYLGTAQDMPTGTITLVNLDATRVDRNSDFNTTTHKFICPVDGVYLALAQVTYYFHADGKLHYAYVYKNAGQYGRAIAHSGVSYRTSASTFCLISCVAGDELTLRGEHNRGSDLALHTGDTDTILVVLLLYPT